MTTEALNEQDRADAEFNAGFANESPDTPAQASPAQPSSPGENKDDQPAGSTQANDEQSGQTTETHSRSDAALPGEPDYKELFAKAEHQRRSIEGQFRRERKRNDELATRLSKLEEQIQQATPKTDPEDPEIARLREDAPEIYAGIQKIVERRIPAATPAPAPAASDPSETTLEQARAIHFATIKEQHADWQEVIGAPDFLAWVNGGIPAWARDKANLILEEGTADEVIGLIGDFKKARSSTHQTRRTEDEVRRERLASSTGVRSGGGQRVDPGASNEVDKNDFAAGWNASVRKK